MSQFVELFGRIFREEEGQDMVEYALLIGLISIVAVASLILAGGAVKTIWEAVVTALGTATAAI
ncbi:MAG: Flp family type IVb pilin [Chloroflexota bacterium]|nr:Flp family type IVb pilin [Chloroflexota bacterium]